MLITLDVVEYKDEAIAGRQIVDSALQGQPVDGAGQGEIGSAEAASGAFFRCGFHGFIQRNHRQPLFAQVEKAESPRKVAILRCN